MNGWETFFAAEVSASAALAGLIFVGISINLDKILVTRFLPNRGGQALILLLTVVVVSSLMLIPAQPFMARGVEVLALGLVVWWSILSIDLRARRQAQTDYRQRVTANLAMNQFATLPYVASGVALLTIGELGLYLLVMAILVSFIKAMTDAWVLLVEINR